MEGRRSGYTLMEVILVMAVLVIVGGIAVPLIKPMMTSRNLDSAADVVRTQWSESRAHAIKEGRPYRFEFQAKSGKFRIAPDNLKYWKDSDNLDEEAGWEYESELPAEVQFDEIASDYEGTNDSWTRATFLADGTIKEKESKIALSRGAGRTITLRLRGSGTVSAAEEHR